MHGAILHPQVIVTLVAEDRELQVHMSLTMVAPMFRRVCLQLLGHLPVVANEHSDSAEFSAAEQPQVPVSIYTEGIPDGDLTSLDAVVPHFSLTMGTPRAKAKRVRIVLTEALE